jgi:integrase
MIRLFNIGVNHIIPCGDSTGRLIKSKLLSRIENKRVPADEMKRRTYTDAEIDAMMGCVADNPMGSLIITLLREVGLRNSAIAYMTYAQLVTVDHVPRTTCAVPEKGKVLRHFVTSTNLQKRIMVYVHHLRQHHAIGDPSKFFLFNIHDPTKPASGAMLGVLLNETATKACVPIHVHAHAFRHTLVGKLPEMTYQRYRNLSGTKVQKQRHNFIG